MGLFDRNDYNRDYHGGGRSLGDRMRGAWNRFAGGGQGGYDRGMRFSAGHGGMQGGYDRDMHGGGWGNQGGQNREYGPSSFAYRGLDGGWSTARNRGAHDVQWDWRAAGGNRYDQDLGPRGGMAGRNDYGRDYGGGMTGRGGYGRDYGARGGYDRDLHGGHDRMHTDAGDPFGDRQNRTPFRLMRGGFDTEQTDRGGWYQGNQGNQLSGGDPNDVNARGWGHGIGDDPVYRPEDFRGRDHGRGRRGPF